MRTSLALAAATLAAGLAFAAPASAQVGTVTGVGSAITANQPSTVGLGMTEGRSGWRHRHWRRHYGFHRHFGFRRHWHHRRHWRY